MARLSCQFHRSSSDTFTKHRQRLLLNEVAENGGRVLNATWQPKHHAIDHRPDYDPRVRVETGYVSNLEYFERATKRHAPATPCGSVRAARVGM